MTEIDPKIDPNDPLEQQWLIDPNDPDIPETMETVWATEAEAAEALPEAPWNPDTAPSAYTGAALPPDMRALLEAS